MKKAYSCFSVLLLCALSCLGMQSGSIHPLIQQAITKAPNVYMGAGIFNEMIRAGHIKPTIANTQDCINILLQKSPGPENDEFRMALRLIPELAQQWLAHYLQLPYKLTVARRVLQSAIEKNDISLAAFLLSSNSAELAQSDAYAYPSQHYSFVYKAAQYNCSEILALLMGAGGDTKRHARSDYQYAPIHIATWNGHYNCVQLLLESGLNPDFPCGHGKSAFYHLCRNSFLEPKHFECAFLLLDHGAQTDIIPAQDLARDQIILNLKKILEHYYTRKKLA